MHLKHQLAILYLSILNQTIIMESQNEHPTFNITDLNQSALIELITKTFRGRTQQQVRQAERSIVQSLNTPGALEKFVALLVAPTEPVPKLKNAVALIIKKYSYEYAMIPGDKSVLFQSVYRLITTDSLQFSAKEVLGTALEHLMEADKNSFKSIVLQNTLGILSTEDSFKNFDGCLVALNAYFNVLHQTQLQLDFFYAILQPVSVTAIKMFKYVSAMSEQQWNGCSKSAMPKIVKLFQFIENIIQQLCCTWSDYQQEIQDISESICLISIIENYLLLFNNNQSIISISFIPINQVKRTIMNIIVMLYKDSKCPLNIFKLLYITFLAQSKKLVDDFQVEQIIIKCISVLESHLDRKLYSQIFADKKLDTIFALLMYSTTNLEQYRLIEQNPQKFVQIAEDFTEASSQIDYVKVKAGGMLQMMISKIDQGLRNTVQIIMMISAQVLQSYRSNQILMPQIRQAFSQYAFYRLSEELKLQTCFMVLANLSVYINKRRDLSDLVGSLFISQFQTIIKITSNLVILRVMRTVSYFPSAIYFLYIQTQMNKGKVFIVEGIKSFERILKTNRYNELLSLLATIFSKLMGVIKISDPIMEVIILNSYDTMLKKSQELYYACRNKIKEEFFVNKDINQMACLACFKFIHALLVKQKEQKIRDELIAQFYQIAEFLEMEENREAYKKYEQNLIEIFTQIITLRSFTSPQIQKFVEQSVKYLSRYQKGSSIFKLYNYYIGTLQGAVFKLQHMFLAIWQEIKLRVELYSESKQSLETVSYFCYLLSQIISNNTMIILNSDDLDQILTITAKVPQQYKQWLLLVFLTYIYQSPSEATKYLKSKGMYESFLLEAMKINIQGPFSKKILILAFIRLIQFEENFNSFNMILQFCVQYLKLQCKKGIKPTMNKGFEIKPRTLGQQRRIDRLQQQYDENDNQLINLFLNFKHPYRKISEFDNFKSIIDHRHGFLKQVNESMIQDIKQILQTQWVDKKTRRIVRVAK